MTTAVTTPETMTTNESGQIRVSLITLLTCWLRPATNGPRLAGLKLRWAYLIHVLAGLAFFFGCLAFVQIDFSMSGSLTNVFDELAREFNHNWEEATLVTLFTVLGIEAGFAALALILLPWGAADERLRSSYAHALRFAWLHTTHALALLLLVGPAMLVLNSVPRTYYRTHRQVHFDVQYPPPPTLPANMTPGSQAMEDYQAAVQQWQQTVEDMRNNWQLRYQQWRRTRPFLVRHNEAIMAFLCTAGSAWFLWALFRATGARRMITAVQRPPTCEFCGYNLTGTAIESRCPECGTPAMESLGPLVRPGTEWDRGGGLRVMWRCAMEAVLRPSMLGRQIQVTTQPHRFRRFCQLLVFAASVVGAITVPVCYVLSVHRNPILYEPEVVTIGVPVAAACSGAGMLMLAMLVASVVGLIQTWQNKRNLLPAAAQMASYLSLLFGAWGIFGAVWTTLFAVVVDSQWFHDCLGTLGGIAVLLAFASLVLPQVIWLGACFMCVWKGTAAASYASK